MAISGNFSGRLSDAMTQLGIKDEELGEALGVGRTAVSQWRTGTRTPRLDRAIALADYLRVPLDELCGRTPPSDEAAEERGTYRREGGQQRFMSDSKPGAPEGLGSPESKDWESIASSLNPRLPQVVERRHEDRYIAIGHPAIGCQCPSYEPTTSPGFVAMLCPTCINMLMMPGTSCIPMNPIAAHLAMSRPFRRCPTLIISMPPAIPRKLTG